MMTTEEAQAYLQKMHEAEGLEEPKTETTEPEANPTDPPIDLSERKGLRDEIAAHYLGEG